MSGEDYPEYNRSVNRKNRQRWSAVGRLDAYIDEEERKFGVINVEEYETGCQPKILESFTDLKSALDRDKLEIEEAYEYLKKSNKAMKKMMGKLRVEMKRSRENIHEEELIDFENLNTDRLLKINPKRFLPTTERGK